MAIVQRQQIRTAQRQIMSPSMWMGLNLLTLPIGDLRDAVNNEIDSNPALERVQSMIPRYVGSAGGDDYDRLENVAANGESLEEHLLGELRMSGVSGREEEICRAIIAELDEKGRFTGTIADLVMFTGAKADEIEAARQRIMAIDPKGCGAYDLKECYASQVDYVSPDKRKWFLKELETLETGKVHPELIKILRKLDAFPGQQYDYRKVEYVIPDVELRKNGDVIVDQRDIPEIRVSPKYVEMAKDRSLDEETRKFAADHVKKAREFRDALIKRQETVEKVAELALEGQPDFLEVGLRGIRKQTMSMVAKTAKCSVATVSRAAARKYVKTPRGTFPLRKFFSLVDLEPQEKLREILSSIPSNDHLSDETISKMMRKAGFRMARRTVAKYRAKLGFATKAD